MRTVTQNLVIILLFCLGSASNVLAKNVDKVEIFFGGGGLSSTGGFERCPTEGLFGSEEIEAQLGSGEAYLLGVSLDMTRSLSLEVSYAHFTTDYIVDLYAYNPQNGEWGYLTGEHTTSLGHIGASIVWNITDSPVTPYVSGGFGWLMFIDAAAFAPQAAAGLKWYPIRHLGLMFETRIFSGHLEDNVDATMGPEGPLYAEGDYSDNFTFVHVVVGLRLRF